MSIDRSDSVSKLELLNTDMLKYHCQGYIIVMDDINSRTGTDSDVIIDTNQHIESDECNGDTINIKDVIANCNNIVRKHRLSKDKVVNKNGKELSNMCISNTVCIVSGRIGENPNGLFNCYTARGESVVEYFLTV